MAQPAQTRRRPAVAVLVIPLLAVLVLAGVGAAAGRGDGARAERVRELAPFTGALTTLVHQLQRERSLSAARVAAGGQQPGAARLALEAVRRAVDGAAAGYRDAAVRVEASHRDRELHQRLDAGLARLAGLVPLRASVDGPGTLDPAAGPATVFRRYTAIVGGLLGLEAEIGLDEAGQDAGLLRAVTAASAFSWARELADREREAAALAAAGGRVNPAERTRLAALGGRQDALLDQFGTLAAPGQLVRYRRALPAAESRRVADLRRAALEGGPGSDLAGWSRATTARVDRMGQIEPGMTAEVARLATLAGRAAGRRLLAYTAVAFLAAGALVVLLVLSRARIRRAHPGEAPPGSGTPEPRPALSSPPVGERSPTAQAGRPVVHTPPVQTAMVRASPVQTPSAEPRAGTGLADLARRSQDLADQQLELLDLVARDQADPRLPGRLLQVDRLAVRARRNAHNLIVLAGGEPGRQWDGPAPLAEVAAAAVSDNRDAHRIDLAVADDQLVPGPAAGDLANLLAELVDNATAFSAPETRVAVRGQKVGSGYVLEVEDRGLGMTDGELEAVNRRLGGDPAPGDDLEQGLGTWVAGRLAERHGVRVQLRRSSYGGITALVFFPERLVGPPGPPPEAEAPAAAEASATPAARDALASQPLRRYMSQVPEPGRPLPRRAPHTSLAPDLVAAAGDPGGPDDPASHPGARSPDQVRSMLTRYRSGLERGRAAAARDLPADPDDDPAP